MKNDGLIKKAREYALAAADVKTKASYLTFPRHLFLVEGEAEKVLKIYPEADLTITILGAWLHDLGHFIGRDKEDHAIVGEEEARKFLATLTDDKNLIEAVAHCVRAHRCKDVQPETIEAKIVAFSDSASHLIHEIVYPDIFFKFDKKTALGKLGRDYRDLALLPKAQMDLLPYYSAWHELLNLLPDKGEENDSIYNG